MNDQELLQNFIYERNCSPNTEYSYKQTIKKYHEITGETLTDLLELAKQEERQGIPWIDRQIKHKLLSFRTQLYKNYSENTAKEYFTRIKAILRHNYIEIHYLPPISTKQTNKPPRVTYKDLPDKTLLQTITNLHNPLLTSINLHMISTGMSKIDTLNLTFQDYINGFKDYNISYKVDPYETLKHINELVDEKHYIQTYYYARQKTGIQNYTFTTPESTKATTEYLLTRQDLRLDSPLFKITPEWLSIQFQMMNDKLGLGKVGYYNRYTTRMLRRYHSTHLKKGLNIEEVDFLQGRVGLSKVQQSYYYEEYDEMKQKYLNNMHLLYINYEGVEIGYKSREFLELENKYNDLSENLEERINMMIMKKLSEFD